MPINQETRSLSAGLTTIKTGQAKVNRLLEDITKAVMF